MKLFITTVTAWAVFLTWMIMSAVSQNQPVMVGIRGVKTSHFMEPKTALRDCLDAGSKGHVERPQSEPSNRDIQST